MLLRRNTGESLAVYRVGPVVYKILRPVEYFAAHPLRRLRMSPAATIDRYRRTAELSWSHPPLNPLLYIAETHVIVSRFIEGRQAPLPERLVVERQIRALRLGIWDVVPWHILVGPDGPVVIDWCC